MEETPWKHMTFEDAVNCLREQGSVPMPSRASARQLRLLAKEQGIACRVTPTGETALVEVEA